MSRTIQQKQIEYFTRRIFLKIELNPANNHYRHGPGTVVKIRKIKDGICVEVQFAEKPGEINFRRSFIIFRGFSLT